MKRTFFSLIVLLNSFIFSSVKAENSINSVFGLWKTADGLAKIEIAPCAQMPQEICGTIVQLQEPLDPETGQEKTDHLNPEDRLKHRKIIGLINLTGFKASDTPLTWTDGSIYHPREGKTYSCELTLISPFILEVRGYIGLPIFGKTQTWTRTTLEESLIPLGQE